MLKLADGFLGLAPLEGATMTMMERRFEIDLPLPVPEGPGKLTITPQPVGKAVAEFFNADKRVSIEVDVYLPPKDVFESGGKKIVFTWPMGRMTLAFDGPNNCNYSENFECSMPHPAKIWLEGLLVSDIVGSGSSKLVFKLPDGQPLIGGAFTVKPMRSRAGIIGLLRRYLEILNDARAADLPVALDTLYENRQAIDKTWQFLQGDTTATFGIAWKSTLKLGNQDGIYISALPLGDGRIFGLAVPMSFTFEGHGKDARGRAWIEPRSAAIELLQEPILPSYNHFVERVTKLTRYPLRVIVDLVEEAQRHL